MHEFDSARRVVDARPLRGAAYIRYSSKMQADGFSLEAQERQIRERARRDGVEIVAVFSDAAHSAYSKKFRPGVDAMRTAARRKEFDILYVHKVDRLARRLPWVWDLVEELQAHNVMLKAVEQNFDLSTPEGKLHFSFLSSLGEFYSDNLSKETRKGKGERAREGYHNGTVPWGYRSELIGKHKQAVLIAELQAILQQMFEHYASGLYSDQQIADWLTSQGYQLSPQRLFTKETVRAMLQNPFYAGKIRYRGSHCKGQNYRTQAAEIVTGKHEAAISEALFEQCQKVRQARQAKVKTRQVTRHVYLLNGIILCSHCGRPLRAQSTWQGTCYYREVSRLRGYSCPLTGRSVHAQALDEQVAALIQALQLPDNWQKTVRDLLRTEREAPDPEVELQRLRAELRRLRENYEHNLYAGEEHVFWRKVEQLQAQIAVLEQSRLPPAAVIAAGEQLVSIQRAWTLATDDERRELTQMMLQEVGCDVGSSKIAWVTPKPGFEVLFQVMPSLRRENGTPRYRHCF